MFVQHLREMQAAIGRYRAGGLPLHALADTLEERLRAAEDECRALIRELHEKSVEVETANALVLEALELSSPAPHPDTEQLLSEALDRMEALIESALGDRPDAS